VARREIQEQVDLARKTQTEWEAMIKKWEANDYKDFDWGCQAKMNEVICSAKVILESCLDDLPPEEQAEYRKNIPDFTMMIKDTGHRSSTKDD